MRPPVTIDELEARLWSLAGERMAEEPLSDVLSHAGQVAEGILHELAPSWRAPVAELFASDAFESRGLDDEEWGALVRTLFAWAGASPHHGFVRAVDGLATMPPHDKVGLGEWMHEHGIRRRLGDPASRAASLAGNVGTRYRLLSRREETIGDVLHGRARGASEAEQAAARSYLSWVVGRAHLAKKRTERWSQPVASKALAEAARGVHGLLDRLIALDTQAGPIPDDGVTMGPTEPFGRWGMTAPVVQQASGRREAWLSLVEVIDGRSLSSLESPRGDLELLRVLAEHVLDAIHDETHDVHAKLREVLERPRWTMLLEELEREVAEADAAVGPFEEDERLVWRAGWDEDEEGTVAVVEPAVQRRRKKGGWTKGRRVELDWLRRRPAPLDPRDRRVLDAMGAQHQEAVSLENHGAVLQALVGHPLVVAYEDATTPLAVREGAVEVLVRDSDAGTVLAIQIGPREFTPMELLGKTLPPAHAAFLDDEGTTVTVAELPPAVYAIALAGARWSTALPAEADRPLLAVLGRLPPHVGLELPPRLRGERLPPDSTPLLRLEPLPGGALRATVLVRPLPSGAAQTPATGPTRLVGTHEGRRVHVVRDFAEERRATERATAELGLDAGTRDGPHTWRLDEPELALDVLSALREHPELATAEWPEDAQPWQVVGAAGWSNTRVRTKKLADWFAVEGEATVDEHKVALARIVRALREGKRYVSLGKGRFAKIEDSLRASLEAASDVVFEEGKELAVSGAALATLEAVVPAERFSPDLAWKALRERLAQLDTLDLPPPPGVEADLRAYQEEGIRWLRRVTEWAEGACLADDMGLGKTLQALALMLARSADGPALVVAPTSLGDNWRREAERFTPELRPVVYRGPDRAAALEGLGPRDVLITSYDVMLRDIEELEAFELTTVVFDEAHALKNPQAQRTKAARRLRAGFRLALTGTPLENHLAELYSLFSVLAPGLLGPWPHFRRRFALPIERDADPARRDALRRLLTPFLLRRTKEQVAPELPPRVEVLHAVELSDDERALYEAERRSALEGLAEDGTKKAGQKRIAVLGALTRLRRLACHPALVDPESNVASSKLEAVLELADDLARDGHRTLMFSQFTTHLALVRTALQRKGYEVPTLIGSTPAAERAKLVAAFQEGTAPFFLISLKAGGTGLNLTAADTVVHLDPWWNPASEDQASDRTHRIGQDKPVTVVRMVCQDTIEEKVLALHAAKRELARGILEGADTNAKLDTEALLELLQA